MSDRKLITLLTTIIVVIVVIFTTILLSMSRHSVDTKNGYAGTATNPIVTEPAPDTAYIGTVTCVNALAQVYLFEYSTLHGLPAEEFSHDLSVWCRRNAYAKFFIMPIASSFNGQTTSFIVYCR